MLKNRKVKKEKMEQLKFDDPEQWLATQFLEDTKKYYALAFGGFGLLAAAKFIPHPGVKIGCIVGGVAIELGSAIWYLDRVVKNMKEADAIENGDVDKDESIPVDYEIENVEDAK